MAFEIRDLRVRQRTQTINAVRGHLMEYGLVVAQGVRYISRLRELIETRTDLPEVARELGGALLLPFEALSEKIAMLEKDLRRRARRDEVASHLVTIPGIGAICATAMEVLAPSAETFAKGPDFAAWIGPTPRQNSSGGKDRLAKTSEMGQSQKSRGQRVSAGRKLPKCAN